MREAEGAARAVGQEIVVFNAANESEIDTAFAGVAQLGSRALLVGSDPYFNSRREQIVALAARHAIPAVYEWREFAQAGGLMSYGTNLAEAYRQARHLRRAHSQGRETRRPTGHAVDQIRAGASIQDRQVARPRCSTDAARHAPTR